MKELTVRRKEAQSESRRSGARKYHNKIPPLVNMAKKSSILTLRISPGKLRTSFETQIKLQCFVVHLGKSLISYPTYSPRGRVALKLVTEDNIKLTLVIQKLLDKYIQMSSQ